MKKLNLNRETLLALAESSLEEVAGGRDAISINNLCPAVSNNANLCGGFSHLAGCSVTCPK